MLIAIDVGNTNIVFVVFNEDNPVLQWRMETHKKRSIEGYGMAIHNQLLEGGIKVSDIKKVVFSSVVPSVDKPLLQVVNGIFQTNPLILGPNLFQHLDIQINNPREIGSDLVANSFAAYHRFRQACLVVDFGTALTFTTVGDKGEILGVAIAPGVRTAMRALSSNTAKLPEVPLKAPKSAIGKDTVQALQAGIILGYAGLVQSLIGQIKQEVGDHCKVIATGGHSSVLEHLHEFFNEVDPMLTMHGLRLIHENEENAGRL